VDSLGKHLHSSQGLFLESKRKLEVREDELSVARSTIAALEARNLELERRSASRDKELFEALKKQEVLEARSSEYDQLRSAVDAGQAKIDELTSDVLRLDMVNSELRGEMADLRARLARATQAESELSGRSSWLQGVVDEQKGLIAGFKAEVSNLSRNLCSVEVERNSARKELDDVQKHLASLQNEMVALKKENADLRIEKGLPPTYRSRHMWKHQEANEKVKRYKHQLDVVHIVRNRTWIHGFEWGLETLRAMAMDERLRHKVPTINIRDIRPDPEALNELKMIGVEELPDARAMWTVPPPIAVLRPAARDEAGAGPSNVSRVEAKAGSSDGAGSESGAEPPDGGSAPPS
jgi:chromosome segregation ATPase